MSGMELRRCGHPVWLARDGGEPLHRRYELWAEGRMIGWIQARSRRKWFHQRSAVGFCASLGDAFDDLMTLLGRNERWKDKGWVP